MFGELRFRSAYAMNLVALIPRHWLAYTPLVAFPVITFINSQGGTFFKQSDHFFMVWLLGVFVVSCLVASVVAEMMGKPVVYCMPGQQRAMRGVVVTLGVLVSVLLFVVAVLPAHSHWAPPSLLGTLSVIPIGLMLYLLIVVMVLRKVTYLIWINVVFVVSSSVISPRYFNGVGTEIVRPPVEVYGLLSLMALVVIPLAWRALGSRASLRERFRDEHPLSLDEASIWMLKKVNLYHGDRTSPGADFSATRAGTRLLNRIAAARPGGTGGLFSNFMYRMRSANQLWRVGIAWLCILLVSGYLAIKAGDDPSPGILLYLLSLMAVFQGLSIFRPGTSPFLPQGRAAYFKECLLNAGLRHLVVIAIGPLVYGLSAAAAGIWPGSAASEYAGLVLALPFKAYLYCVCLAPSLLFLLHVSRHVVWMVFMLLFNMAMVAAAPQLTYQFAQLGYATIGLLMVGAWVPFLYLNYRKSFLLDRK